MKSKIEKYIIMYGLFVYPLFMGLMVYTWFKAYFSTNHTMMFTVNMVGESGIEFILLFLIFPISVYTSFSLLKKCMQ